MVYLYFCYHNDCVSKLKWARRKRGWHYVYFVFMAPYWQGCKFVHRFSLLYISMLTCWLKFSHHGFLLRVFTVICIVIEALSWFRPSASERTFNSIPFTVPLFWVGGKRDHYLKAVMMISCAFCWNTSVVNCSGLVDSLPMPGLTSVISLILWTFIPVCLTFLQNNAS